MSTENANETVLSRRRMLMRLGLAATAAYAAPVMLSLDKAHASGGSRRSFSGSGRRRRRGGRRRRNFT